MPVSIRPFRRSDRDQLADLVNAHVAAVVPGFTVSVNAVLSQLEREPGEFVVDPWVVERETLVAEQRGRIVAAAHLLRYGTGEEVGPSYRDAGEMRWLLSRPETRDAGRAAGAAAIERLRAWDAARLVADCSLPAPGVHGVPEQWPHVAALLEELGFVPARTEVVLLARVDDLPREPAGALELRRSVGVNGTRLTALAGAEELGYVEVDLLADGSRAPRTGGWADLGNLEARDDAVRTWLLAQAAEWLRLGGIDRLLDYADDDDDLAWRERLGFRVLTRTRRGWSRAG